MNLVARKLTPKLTAIEELARIHRRLAMDLLMRVARGAQVLDQVEPGWFRRVALDELAMSTCDHCILGQLHGEFSEGFWNITRPLPSTRIYSAAHLGFTLHDHEQDDEDSSLRFNALGDAWRFQVRLRLAEG